MEILSGKNTGKYALKYLSKNVFMDSNLSLK